MMESLVIALTVGVTVFTFGGMGLRAIRDRAGKRKASNSVERFAGTLGLSYEPARMLDKVGALEGVIGAHKIAMDVFPSGRVRVTWSEGKKFALDLRARTPHTRPDDGMVEFSTGNRKFDKLFEQRYAGSAVAEVFASNPELTSALVEFATMRKYNIGGIGITEYSLDCRLEKSASYNEPLLTTLLADTVALVDRIEPMLKGCELGKSPW